MEIFLLIVILVFAIIIYNNVKSLSSDFNNQIKTIERRLDDLNRQISYKQFIENEIIEKVEPEAEPILDDSNNQDVKIDEPQIFVTESEPIVNVAFSNLDNADVVTEISETISKDENEINSREQLEPESIEEFSTIQKPNLVPQKSWIERFKEKNPDIEKFVGENLINKIGILILVLGVSFFVKFAIDQDWINEPARVGIGILAGSIVMGVAHKLRKNYAAFSSVFVAGAVSIYYLTIGIAFHDYQLFSQTVAFVIMVIITIFSALISVSYNRKELAVLTLIGGFAVPFMVSTGSGNYKVLFTYIAILNVGMLIISFYKKWNIVTLLAFIFTIILYGSWFGIEFYKQDFPYKGALIFASLFYFIFSIATVINNIRNKGRFTKVEYMIMLSNTFLYFGIGSTIFLNWQPQLKGVFTISLALYNLVFSIVLYRKFGVNKDAIYFLLGLALTFITLTIPIQFSGNSITLFWAAEAVLLLWLSQKSKIATFRVGAIAVQILLLFSLVLDWGQSYSDFIYPVGQPFLNKIFITGLASVISFVLCYVLLKKEKDSITFYFLKIDPNSYRRVLCVTSIIVGYFVGLLEIHYQANALVVNYSTSISYLVLYHFVFCSILIYFLFKNKNKIGQVVGLFISGVNILLYIVVFSRLSYNEFLNNFLDNSNYHFSFIAHYLLLVCIVFYIVLLIKNKNQLALSPILTNKFTLWVLVFCIVFILSNEIMIHSYFFSLDVIKQGFLSQKVEAGDLEASKSYYYEHEFGLIKKRVIKVGFPILWGLLSFVFLIIGIKKQFKQLRIIALSLLGLTVLKLFIFDINVSGPGRIVAFILLGILILIISFVYQKLNRKQTQNETKEHDHENDN